MHTLKYNKNTEKSTWNERHSCIFRTYIYFKRDSYIAHWMSGLRVAQWKTEDELRLPT